MTTLSIQPSFAALLGSLSLLLPRLPHRKTLSAEDAQEARERRRFVLEMMDACPDAFDHEDALLSGLAFWSGRC